MLKKIVFLLQQQEHNNWMDRLRELWTSLEEKEIACVLQCVMPEKSSDDLQGKQDTIYIVDTESVAELLRQGGHLVLPYRHQGNPDEKFPGENYPYIIEEIEEMDYEAMDLVYRRLVGLPWNILTTKRCIVRETTVEDVDSFYQLYADDSVTAYMEALYPDREQEIAYIQDYNKRVYQFYGYGMWTVLDRETGCVIGRVGISWREGFDVPELGFMLGVAWQHKGYAFEMCQAVLTYAREQLEMDAVQALVMEGNVPSERLCARLGFEERGKVVMEGKEYNVYHRVL